MEDAKIHKLDVIVDQKNYSIFAVFDGHGGILLDYLGPEVSKFVENHFVQELLENREFKKGNVAAALEQTFRKMDEIMLE